MWLVKKNGRERTIVLSLSTPPSAVPAPGTICFLWSNCNQVTFTLDAYSNTMESMKVSRQDRHFDPSDPIFAKGNFVFELAKDGTFTVCRNKYVADSVESRSESSSMEANWGSVLDVASVPIDDFGYGTITRPWPQEPAMELFKASEQSLLVRYAGDWSVGYVGNLSVEESPKFPWRLEAVNLEDLELEPYTFESVYAKPAGRPELINRNIAAQVPQWNPKSMSLSVAESSESVPPLTEDYSRDTDSIVMSEPVVGRDDILILNTSDNFRNHEIGIPLSPLLGSRWPGFRTQFDDAIWPRLERENRPLTPDRPSTRRSGSYPGDEPVNADQEILGEDDDCFYSEVESADSNSIWMSDYSESEPAIEEGHPFLLIKPTVVREALLAFQAWQQRPQDPSQNPSAIGSSALQDRGSSSNSSRSKRDRENGEGSEESRDSGDGQDGAEKRPRTSKKTLSHQVSFACPFAKKDPLKYRRCYAFVLKRIQDVKQHLSRCHQLPIYCPRCMFTFENESARDEHIRASSCALQDAIAYEGVTRAQKTQLSQRVSSKMTLGDQWFTIFDILFPGHTPRPRSAYINVELTIDLEAFQDLMYTEGPNIIATAIRSSGIHVASMSNEERDLSVLLQSAIEEGLQIIAQRWLINVAPSAATTSVALAEGSASSRIVEGAQPSLASSDTLVEAVYLTSATEESQRKQDDDDEGAQTYRGAQDMIMDVTQPSPGGSNALQVPSSALNLEQGYYEAMSDVTIEYDDDFWKLHEGNDFPTLNDYENPNAPSQQSTTPSGAQ